MTPEVERPMPGPTEADKGRDLAADLRSIETVNGVVDHGQRADRIIRIIHVVAPAAIRRAVASEEEVNRLTAENAKMRQLLAFMRDRFGDDHSYIRSQEFHHKWFFKYPTPKVLWAAVDEALDGKEKA